MGYIIAGAPAARAWCVVWARISTHWWTHRGARKTPRAVGKRRDGRDEGGGEADPAALATGPAVTEC